VSLDGGEPTRITDTPEGDAFIGAVGDRVIFMRYIPETELTARQTVMSARSDGSDAITLHDDATEISTIVDGRVVLLVGNPNYDLVSISAAGGDITVLSDSDREDWPVGRLRRILIVQRSVLDGHGEVLRVDVDGSGAVRLASSARYLGAVTEECGLVRGGRQYLSSCAD
jgi:hypothetical protein